jgi:hypothetical protein
MIARFIQGAETDLFLILFSILGGRGLTKGGMGGFVEEFHRTYKFDAGEYWTAAGMPDRILTILSLLLRQVLGGSEEILADLGVRQALRNYPVNEKL